MLTVDQRFVRFTVREPNRAYKDTMLWVPKTHPESEYLANSSRVILPDGVKYLWTDSGNHYVLPRELIWGHPTIVVGATPNRISLDHTRIQTRDAAQEEAWAALRDSRGGILNLACGKGKTVLGIKKIAYENVQACVVVGQSHLVDQWVSEAKSKLGVTDNDIGIVQGNKQQWDRPIVIAMLQTLAGRAADVPLHVREGVGLVIFDECHHLSAPFFLRSVPIFYGMRFGLTATPEREDGTEIIYQSHIGPIFYSDITQDVPASIYFQELSTRVDLEDPRVRKHVFDRRDELNYGMFCSYLGKLKSRNLEIAEHINAAVAAGRRPLILGHSVSGLKRLRDLIAPKNTVVYKDVKSSQRAEIIRREIPAFATVQIAQEALDVPEIDTVFYLTPLQAWAAWTQGVGRGQRRVKGKKKVMAIMFEDRRISVCKGLCNKLKTKINAKGYSYEEIRNVRQT